MKRLLISLTLCLYGLNSLAFADYDAAGEAKADAARAAAKVEQAKRESQMNSIKHDAEMKAQRGFLGADSVGKSDADVQRLYNARIQGFQANAMKMANENQATTKKLMKQEADTRGQRDEAMKAMTGKSINEISNMSEADLDKLANDLEKKYGN